jgi:HD-GYP domain-containing protein (c-di-GMP phosphodiesterase class II)
MASVLTPELPAAASHPSSRHISHANLLRKEFATPFAIFDAGQMQVVYSPDDFPYPERDAACLQLVRRVTSRGQPELCPGEGPWELLGLPIWKGNELVVVAVGVFRRWDDRPPSDACDSHEPAGCVASYPPHCLENWATAVAERQRLADRLRGHQRQGESLSHRLNASAKTLQIFDRLAGRMRISERPDKFPKLALSSLLEMMSVECVAWVPANQNDAVALTGESSFDVERLRRVVQEALAVGDAAARRSFVENNASDSLWGIACPSLLSFCMVGADEKKPAGWLVATNKGSGDGFSASDTALMRPIASLLNVFRKNLNVYADLKELLFGVVRALSSAIDAKDPYTRGHSERVARIAVCLGRQLMLGTDELSNLYLAGLLHDVGKIGVEDHVLKKPDRLTPAEYRHVMSHVEIGVSILRELKRLRHVLPGILHHHERYGGGGYPDGIKGDEIPYIARILAVADSFDAMSSNRVYRPRRNPVEVEEILRSGANDQWDPKVVEAALSCWHELCAIQQRGLGESLRVAVDDALHQDYPAPDGSKSAPPAAPKRA